MSAPDYIVTLIGIIKVSDGQNIIPSLHLLLIVDRIMKVTELMTATGCSRKIVFFTMHFNPSLAYIAVRDLQSSQRNASVQLLLLAGQFDQFLYTQ